MSREKPTASLRVPASKEDLSVQTSPEGSYSQVVVLPEPAFSPQVRKFTVGIDYSFQQYSAIDSGSDVIRFKDRNRITVGLSYVPGKYDVRRYWKRIKFMAGASVDDSYIVASGSPGLNWGVSAGMSFPLRNATSFYWSLNFNRYSFPPVNRNTISESSLGLTFGISFGESWFVRKRLE